MEQIEARRYTVWIARALGYLALVYVAVTEIILLLGFVLKAFGANPDVGFTQWAYRNLDRVMAPFRGIFGTIDLGTNGNNVAAVLDMSILFAMVIYGILLLVLRALIDWLTVRIHMIDDKRALQASAASAPSPSTIPPRTVPPRTMPPPTVPLGAPAASAVPSSTVFESTTASPTTVPPAVVESTSPSPSTAGSTDTGRV